MRRRTAIVIMTAVVLVGTLGALPAAGITQPASSDIEPMQYAVQELNGNETDRNANDIRPGERLSGVIGVQEAEFEGEMERRTFGIRVARAATTNAKAEVVKDRLDSIQQRLEQLKQRKQELQQARENGSISSGRFKAEMAQLAARTETMKGLANESETRAQDLPRSVLESKNINVTAIQLLRQNAEALSGPAVAEMARSIAGPNVGIPVGGSVGQGGPPGERDPDIGESDADDAQQAIDRAERRIEVAQNRVEQTRERINQTNRSENAVKALRTAEEQLQQAKQTLEDARAALDAGNNAKVLKLAQQAIDYAARADQTLEGIKINQGGSDTDNTGQDSSRTDGGSQGGPGTETRSGDQSR